uniref:Uncharacterized protein n=1 Tax=Schistosoma haematobium TaxID=6185 RepID=A0A095CCS6_SCHHA
MSLSGETSELDNRGLMVPVLFKQMVNNSLGTLYRNVSQICSSPPLFINYHYNLNA